MKINNPTSPKPQYHMPGNLLYMLRHAAAVPGVLGLLGAEVASGVAVSVTALYMAPSFLRLLENHGTLRELLLTIAAFSLVMICLNGVETYVKTIKWVGRNQVRLGILQEIDRKLGTCSYALLFSREFQDKRVSARSAIQSNRAATREFWETLRGLSQNVICFLIYLVLMARVKPALAVMATLITGIGFAWTRRFDRWGYAHRREEADILRRGNYFYNCVRNRKLAKDIRIFGMQDWLWDLEQDALRLFRDFRVRSEKNNLTADIIGIALDLLRNGLAYAYLLAVTLQGGLSAAEFLLYFTAASGFTAQVTGILSGVGEMYRESLEISSVREFCGMEEPFLLEGGRKIKHCPGDKYEFEFKDVTFCYPYAEKPVLEHFNLKIRAGEKLAVVGLNGAGKTTMIRLLCGLFDPDSGQVLMNGIDIRAYNRRDYYDLFGAVFQDFSVLAGTISENVSQSRTPDRERVKECLEQAGIGECILRLPGQCDTKLNRQVYPEDAVELSGGELQRLMLARMLYKGAPVLILDEPTAALDALAERDIYERYEDFTKGSTAVYISHRLASTRFCDRVILLGEGGILEEGTHEELMNLGGRYAELFEIQSKYYKDGQEQGR
ncbi:MAG: ABC transporter ATP-binding protein/permease [Lachnospiraceae bacterium]|nr:ABC transporter ATP-binding protein/permease [Lachnospiraceae bacterium]MCM1238706.1 ABC transporter ATP-binding protein/permease [Lachnospiraceae bacterium]